MKKIIFFSVLLSVAAYAIDKVERWDYYEITLNGPAAENPYTDIHINATFHNGDSHMTVSGFYNGEGVYKIRFMPSETGIWSYQTESNVNVLHDKNGRFKCISAKDNVHGIVEVDKVTHFKYSDGTPYYPFGTTLYSWIHQPDSVQQQTLRTLSQSPFNKVRMCIFPQNHYWYDSVDPELYAFEGEANDWDFSHFNPEFFNHLEKRILQLRDMGIECDLILLHPYDVGRWGFDKMTDEQVEFYLRYVMARFGSFRHIWWSAANEFDLIESRDPEDWDRILQLIQKEDVYQHLRSIHHCKVFYDYSKPWVTHASIQKIGIKMREWLKEYNKPVIVDECGYEGNIPFTWGDLTPEHMVHQFWTAMTNGGYASHGETYLDPSDYIWWSHGGRLLGQSIERIAFLKEIVESFPTNGLAPFNASSIKWNRLNYARINDDSFLFYLGERQHGEWHFELPENQKYKVEIIDTWNMTITEVEGVYCGATQINLPTKPYIALRITTIKE